MQLYLKRGDLDCAMSMAAIKLNASSARRPIASINTNINAINTDNDS